VDNIRITAARFPYQYENPASWKEVYPYKREFQYLPNTSIEGQTYKTDKEMETTTAIADSTTESNPSSPIESE
jgi:hypothetical protein